MTTKTQSVLIGCRNDKDIIKRMKAVGIWKEMKAISKPGEAASILNGDELFIWHGAPGDSGYTFFKSSDPVDLMLLIGALFGNPLHADDKTRH